MRVCTGERAKERAMLFTYTSGEPTAPAIIFLHGAGLSGRMWQPQMESLTDYYCLAPDLPEQGKSQDSGPFQLEDAARRVIELIEERIPSKRAHLVGLSLGAAVALAIMRLAPANVDHAIVTGTAPLKGYGKFAIALIPLMKFFSVEKQIEAAYKQFGIPEAYRAVFREDLLLTSTPEFTRHSIEALIELNSLLPCESEAATLVAVGERENGISKQGAKKFAACLKNGQRIVVPGVGHVWNLEAPELFTETVRNWIEDRALPESLQVQVKTKAAQ